MSSKPPSRKRRRTTKEPAVPQSTQSVHPRQPRSRRQSRSIVPSQAESVDNVQNVTSIVNQVLSAVRRETTSLVATAVKEAMDMVRVGNSSSVCHGPTATVNTDPATSSTHLMNLELPSCDQGQGTLSQSNDPVVLPSGSAAADTIPSNTSNLSAVRTLFDSPVSGSSQIGSVAQSDSCFNSSTSSDTVITKLLSASLAPSTRNSYKRVLSQFLDFHQAKFPNQAAFPVSQNVLTQFIVHLFQLKLSSATIYSYMSAISFVHKLENMADPTDLFFIKKLLKGVQNSRQVSDCRLPITLDILHRIINAMSNVIHPLFKVCLCRAMFLLAFHAFLRIGEFTLNHNNSTSKILQTSDINFLRDDTHSIKAMTVRIVNFKHSENQTITLEIPIKANKNYCPVLALHSYLQMSNHTSGPLFQFADKSPVTYSYFCKSLQAVLKFLQLDTRVYKGHSFRIGAATTASQLGVPQTILQKYGRWKSDAVRSYIRIGIFK
ncbi:uncharacterized protein [Argopecten irradians]|uniref:uncharacterized protein isoform X2 n=1 Tax=Argopecten irradians TaxID=31199 RepID=UPI00371A3420